MIIHKVIGQAIRRAIFALSKESFTGDRFTFGKTEYSAINIPKDKFDRVLANTIQRDGYVWYNLDADTVIKSKWSVDALRRVLKAADGIVCVTAFKGGTTVCTYRGEYDPAVAEKLAQRLNDVMTSNVRDSQRDRLYSFEATSLAQYIRQSLPKGLKWVMTEAEAYKFARRIGDDYGIDPTKFELMFTSTRSHGRLAFAKSVVCDPLMQAVDYLGVEVHTNKSPITPWIMCHEMAHIVNAFENGISGRFRGHGDQFTAVYIELLARYTLCDVAVLISMFEDAKLAVDTNSIYDHENCVWGSYVKTPRRPRSTDKDPKKIGHKNSKDAYAKLATAIIEGTTKRKPRVIRHGRRKSSM